MSKIEKQINRLKSKPRDLTYNEIKNLLNNLGFYENNKGKTSGSRVVFINIDLNKYIEIHKPHPRNILKAYQVNSIIKLLEEWRIL